VVEIEAREVEQRIAERSRREYRELHGGQALAREDRLDERDARGLCLGLQRLGLVLRHDAVLRKGARESADVAGGGVRGHDGRQVVRSRVGVSAGKLRKQTPCRRCPARCYSIRIKLN
jgi:hypothetical protein